jgi:heme/copper-type cytochrome/quinol oxidase subunit 2
MRAPRRAGLLLSTLISGAAYPALALAQSAPPPQERSVPGGVASAWPLGLIVLLVAAMMLWGAWVDRRRRRVDPRGPAR